MKEIRLYSGGYLLVEVPEDVTDIQMHKAQGLMQWLITYFSESEGGTSKMYLPDYSQWQIIGKANGLTEDDWKEIVDKEMGGFFGHISGYKDYKPTFIGMDMPPLQNATISGLNLIAYNSMKPETTLILKQEAKN